GQGRNERHPMAPARRPAVRRTPGSATSARWQCLTPTPARPPPSEVGVDERKPAQRGRIVARSVDQADLYTLETTGVVVETYCEPALPGDVVVACDRHPAQPDRAHLDGR